MEEWFTLVNRKNLLVRQESDLVYELRDLELIEQHDQLEKEIRQRVAKDGNKIFYSEQAVCEIVFTSRELCIFADGLTCANIPKTTIFEPLSIVVTSFCLFFLFRFFEE